jgi:hypothetical protein
MGSVLTEIPWTPISMSGATHMGSVLTETREDSGSGIREGTRPLGGARKRFQNPCPRAKIPEHHVESRILGKWDTGKMSGCPTIRQVSQGQPTDPKT